MIEHHIVVPDKHLYADSFSGNGIVCETETLPGAGNCNMWSVRDKIIDQILLQWLNFLVVRFCFL